MRYVPPDCWQVLFSRAILPHFMSSWFTCVKSLKVQMQAEAWATTRSQLCLIIYLALLSLSVCTWTKYQFSKVPINHLIYTFKTIILTKIEKKNVYNHHSLKKGLLSHIFNPNALCLEKKSVVKIISILKAAQYFSEMFSVRCILYGEHQLLTVNTSIMSLAHVILRK